MNLFGVEVENVEGRAGANGHFTRAAEEKKSEKKKKCRKKITMEFCASLKYPQR